MIRPITVIATVLFLLSGFAVFYVKHQVNLLDLRIEHTVAQIHRSRDHIRLLRADWADENAPDRLGKLAKTYLTLQPTAPGQFASPATLAARLPPIRKHPDRPFDQPPPALVATTNGAANGAAAGAGTALVAATSPAAPAAAPATPAAPAPSAVATATPPPAAAPPSTLAPVRLARQPVPAPMPAPVPAPARPIARPAAHPILRPAVAPTPPPIATRIGPLAPPAAPRPARRYMPPPPRLTPARYRPPAYRPTQAWHPPARPAPRPYVGGSMLGMAGGATAAPPPPAPMPYTANAGD